MTKDFKYDSDLKTDYDPGRFLAVNVIKDIQTEILKVFPIQKLLKT